MRRLASEEFEHGRLQGGQVIHPHDRRRAIQAGGKGVLYIRRRAHGGYNDAITNLSGVIGRSLIRKPVAQIGERFASSNSRIRVSSITSIGLVTCRSKPACLALFSSRVVP